MPRTIDLTGKKFGNLTVIKKAGKNTSNAMMWRCRCSCGNEIVAYAKNLSRGFVKDCGKCQEKEETDMKKVLLLGLKLNNFMGVKDFELKLDGHSAEVRGQNSKGKTTLKHAFHWVLFGKDADFNALTPKPVDDDGNAVHNLETSVECSLSVDGKVVTLKRSLTEKWTKKRGSREASFTGHQEKFWVNEVPIKAGEYKATAAEMIGGEDEVKGLVDPFYVCSKMHWQKRRALLLDICGDVDDEDVYNADPELEELQELVGDHSLEDYKNILKDRMKALNGELKSIPARIDELSRMTELPEWIPTKKELLAKKKELNGEIRGIKAQLKPQTSDKLDLEMSKLQMRLDRMEMEKDNDEQKRLNALLRRIDQAHSRYNEIAYSINKIKELKGDIEQLKSRIEKYRKEYVALAKEEFTPADDETCPVCGQPLPEELQEEAYNRNKSQKLAKIKEEGTRLSRQLKELETEAKKEHQLEQDLAERAQEIANLEEARDNFQASDLPPEYEKVQRKLEELQAQKDGFESDSDGSELQDQLDQLTKEREEIIEALGYYDRESECKKRIKELEKEEKRLADQWIDFERQKFLIEKFVRTKVQLLEEKVLDVLDVPGINVKLFEELVNGGLREVCEITYDGVSFDDGLNTGSRLFIGLCFIMVLGKYYGKALPVFLDNAESFTGSMSFFKSQVIKLIADPDYEELEVEIVES